MGEDISSLSVKFSNHDWCTLFISRGRTIRAVIMFTPICCQLTLHSSLYKINLISTPLSIFSSLNPLSVDARTFPRSNALSRLQLPFTEGSRLHAVNPLPLLFLIYYRSGFSGFGSSEEFFELRTNDCARKTVQFLNLTIKPYCLHFTNYDNIFIQHYIII